jgi:hypothetical protein
MHGAAVNELKKNTRKVRHNVITFRSAPMSNSLQTKHAKMKPQSLSFAACEKRKSMTERKRAIVVKHVHTEGDRWLGLGFSGTFVSRSLRQTYNDGCWKQMQEPLLGMVTNSQFHGPCESA